MPPPTIYEEILTWSTDRPAWQRDALRRLASKTRLTDADNDELAKQCLAARGLETVTVAPVPLAADHLPQQGAASGLVTITKLCAVKNVGTLLADQSLGFSEKGLTIVYGDNGSGKSSYARILKRLCRARGAHEGLKSNVFDEVGLPPAATVEFVVGGTPSSVEWKDDGTAPAPSPLSHVAVFDQLAAVAYVGDKQDASVRPAGLDLLTGLVTACEAVRARIQGRLSAAKGAAQPLTGFDATTVTGAFVAGLTASTTDEAVEKAAAFTDAEKTRSESLAKDIARLDAEDPQRVAKELRTRRARMDALRERVENILSVLSPTAIGGLETLRQTSQTKEQAATLASSLSFGGALPGVGGEVWRELWEAARRYSTSTAYPQQPFPVVAQGAQCVLCQQSLDAAARDRMPKFEEFVRNTAAAEARAARAALDAAKKRLVDLPVAMAEDGVLEQELDEVQPQLGSTTHAALERAVALRQALLTAIAEGKPLPSIDVVGQLVEQLRAASGDVEKRAQEALASHDPAKKQQLQRELAELKARAALAERKVEVVAYVKRARTIALLEKCLTDASTNAITGKNTELTKRAVTESLKAFFDEERKGLGLDRTPVELGSAGGARGVLYHQLSLRGARADATPTNVLSEGEQRVCALASFLAETRVAQSKSAIIFDDPVSSFDHLRREGVARRLGREAAERQVIVFTHDAVFLLALLQAAEDWAAPLRVHHVQTYGDAAGHCSEGLPWVGMKVSTRLGHLKNELVKADKMFRNNERAAYNAVARQLYGMLRETWERAIEEVLFGDVLQRLRLSVETKRLKGVDLAPGDYDRIERGMGKASAQLVGHDQPAAMNTPAPQPDELKADITDLEEWVEAIRQRRKKKN